MYCKICKQDKNQNDFYRSNNSVCKSCIKQRSKENRLKNLAYYQEYDRKRSNLPHRIAARKNYQETDNYKASHQKANQKFRQRNHLIYQAHNIVNNAIRDGKLEIKPCLICGEKAQAHHFDYSLPLNVIWLCDIHHKNAHKIENEIKRQLKNIVYF